METFLVLAFLLALVALGVFIWMQSKSKGRFGLGALRQVCPRCGTKMPLIRKPASKEEALWGGWTCANCGCAVDKYGKERTQT